MKIPYPGRKYRVCLHRLKLVDDNRVRKLSLGLWKLGLNRHSGIREQRVPLLINHISFKNGFELILKLQETVLSKMSRIYFKV